MVIGLQEVGNDGYSMLGQGHGVLSACVSVYLRLK